MTPEQRKSHAVANMMGALVGAYEDKPSDEKRRDMRDRIADLVDWYASPDSEPSAEEMRDQESRA